eukprot:1379327-Rhodomonas_salina.2
MTQADAMVWILHLHGPREASVQETLQALPVAHTGDSSRMGILGNPRTTRCFFWQEFLPGYPVPGYDPNTMTIPIFLDPCGSSTMWMTPVWQCHSYCPTAWTPATKTY